MSPSSAGLRKPGGTSDTLRRRFGVVVRLLPPEPERTADGGRYRGEGGLVEAGVVSGSRHGGARLLLPDLLHDLPDAPAEDRVASIDDSHRVSFPARA